MATTDSSQQRPLPQDVHDFIMAFMRTLNTMRLYTGGHDLIKRNIEQLYSSLRETSGVQPTLFIGCAKDSFFLDNSFYQPDDKNLLKFLRFFHSLRVSHVILNKNIDIQDLESFIEILASAQSGQGEEVSKALLHEGVKGVKIGLIDYSIFSTVQNMATRLSERSGNEAIWRQLIIQPGTVGIKDLDPGSIEALGNLFKDVEGYKDMVLQMDKDLLKDQGEISMAQRGVFLSNFILNLGNILSSAEQEKKDHFIQLTIQVLDSLDPQLKIHIMGAVNPEDSFETEGSVIHEVLEAISENRCLDLLAQALKEAGGKSACFNNLLKMVLKRFRNPALLLELVNREMVEQATQKGDVERFNLLRQLEQLLIQFQETKTLNEQYRQEIEALATSIQLQEPMVEEVEMKKLLKSLEPETVGEAKAKLIIDLIRHPHPTRMALFLPSQMEDFGKVLKRLLEQKRFQTVGDLIYEAYLVITEHPMEDGLRSMIGPVFTAKEIEQLLEHVVKECRTYTLGETKAMDAICHLYPEKVGDLLLDLLLDRDEGDDTSKGMWLHRVLTGISPRITRQLSRRMEEASEEAIPKLLDLMGMSKEVSMVPSISQYLDHPDTDIQISAIQALGRLRAENFVSQISDILLKKSWLKTRKTRLVQTAAAQALAEIGTVQARETLKKGAEQGRGAIQQLCKELS